MSSLRSNGPSASDHAQLMARRKSLFWRIHFWAALIASPFAVVATFTGILYIFTPQIEAHLYASWDRVAVQAQRRPLAESVQAAQAAAPPGMRIKAVMPPEHPDRSVRVDFSPQEARGKASTGHNDHNRISRNYLVYVDPYTARVLGGHPEMDRFNMWSKRLHSSLLQGENWRWMIELSTSWLMVMLATGLYLWWPRTGTQQLAQAGTARAAWARWHAWIGVGLLAMSLAILLTGLTWSKYAGAQIKSLRDLSGQAPPTAPAGLKSIARPGEQALDIDRVWQAAQKLAPPISLSLTPPRGPEGVWRVTHFDRSQPTKRFELILNAYNAEVLYRSGWTDQTAFSKATAIGIPFHRGEFGIWNQALLLLFGLGLLASIVSGWVMFWKRFKTSKKWMPRLLPGAWASAPIGFWLLAAAFLALMPTLAISAALVLAIEAFWRWSDRAKAVATP